MTEDSLKRRKRLICIGLIALFTILTRSLIVPPADAQTSAPAGSRTVLRAVIPYDVPPTYFQDPKTHKASGFAVDVMDEIAARAGFTVTYSFEKDWPAIIAAVRSGRADIAPVLGMSEERKKLLIFTLPVETEPVSLFVRSDNASIRALRTGLTVGVLRGSAAYEAIKNQFPSGVELKRYEHFNDGLFDLLAGQTDIFCCPAPTLMRLARDAGLEDKIKIVGAPLMELKRGMAMRKDDKELFAKINAVTEAFVGSPEYQRIYTKWFGRPRPYFVLSKQNVITAIALSLVIIAMAFWRHQSLLGMNRRLRQSEAEVKEAQNIARIGRWELDLLRDSLQWSDTIFKIFEIEKTRFGATYEAFLEAIHPDDRELVNKAYTDSLKNKQPYEIMHRLLMKDGRIKWVSEMCRTDYNPQGQAIRSVGIVQDITERKQAEERLRKSESQLRESQEVAKLGSWDLDLVSQKLEWSDQTYRLFDKDPRDFVPTFHEFARLVHPDDSAVMQANFNKALENDANPYHVAVRIINDSGREWVMEAFGVVRRNPSGNAHSIFGTAQDITERKRAEDNIQQSELRYRNLFESSTDGIFIIDLDGNFIDANTTAYTRLGYTKKEMLALHISKLDDPAFSHQVPERMKRIHEEGFAVFEAAHLRKDGTSMPVEVNSRLMEYEGRTVFFSQVRDITERKKAEDALRESEKRYHLLFDQSPDGIVLIDLAGNILEFNEAAHRQLGYSRAEFAQLRLSDIDPVENTEEIRGRLGKIQETGKARFDVKHRTKQGEPRDVDVIAQAMILSDRPVVHTIWHDITERKLAEEQIRVLASLIDIAPASITVHDMEGNFLYANQTAFDLHGYTKDEFLALKLNELDVPEDAQLIAARLQQIMENQQASFEVGHYRKDRTIIPMHVFTKLTDWGGKKVVLSIASDITERMRVDEKLRKAKTDMELFFSVVPDLLCVASADGYFTSLNREWEKTLGFTIWELLSEPFETWIHPDDMASTRAEMGRQLQGEPAVSFVNRYRCKDGSYRWLEWNVTPAHGRLLYGAARDITERKRSEDALQQSEKRYRQLFENMQEGFIIQDVIEVGADRHVDVRYLDINPAMERFLGKTRSEVIGKTRNQVLGMPDPAVVEAINRVAITGQPFHMMRYSSGAKRWYESFSYSFGPGQVATLVLDITERKTAEERILRSLKEKNVLLKEIHHRVKNNMQVIYSLLNLQAKGITDKTVLAMFAESRDRVASMALIHEKLYGTKDLAHIDFKEYLRSLVGNIADTYQRHDIAYDLDMEEITLDVNVGIPCGLIVNELVSNSLKYAFPDGRKGTIKLGINKNSEGDHVLTVADDGIGFPAEVDFRNTVSLGMKLVNVLTGQIRGTIELSKEEGTRFTITFPGNANKSKKKNG